MKKIIIAILLVLLPVICLAGPLQEKLKGVLEKKNAVATHQHTIYITDNTTTFDSINYDAGTCLSGVKDAILVEAAPTYNYGGCTQESNMALQWAPEVDNTRRRVIIAFPITANVPSGATIDSVELKFRGLGYGLADNDFTVHRVTDAHVFVEGTTCEADTNNVSWNNYATGSAWDTAGVAHDASSIGSWDADTYCNLASWGPVVEVSNGIRTYVQNIASGSATDYGLLLKSNLVALTSYNTANSSDGTDGNRPYLKIVYSH